MGSLNRRRLAFAVGAVLLATTGLVLTSGPAFAVLGRVVVTQTSVSDSSSPKGLIAPCPAGTVPVGGGGSITSGGPGVTVVQDGPSAAGWAFTAIEQNNGTALNWSVTVWAVCAPAPAGYQVVAGIGSVSPSVEAVATCPGLKKVAGAGGALEAPTGDNVRVIVAIQPSGTLTNVTVRAVLDPTNPAAPVSNVVKAYAICVNPQPGQQLAFGSTISDSLDKTVSVACPAPTVPHGVGAVIGKGSGTVNLTALRPATNPATFAAAEHAGGHTGPWSLTGYAICLR